MIASRYAIYQLSCFRLLSNIQSFVSLDSHACTYADEHVSADVQRDISVCLSLVEDFALTSASLNPVKICAPP